MSEEFIIVERSEVPSRMTRGRAMSARTRAILDTAHTGKALFLPANGVTPLELMIGLRGTRPTVKKHGLELKSLSNGAGVFVWAEKKEQS